MVHRLDLVSLGHAFISRIKRCCIPIDGSAVGGDEANMSRSQRKVFSNFSKGFLRGMALTSALGGNNSNCSEDNLRKSTSIFFAVATE